MNWAKGRTTKGRGTSFKGALAYVLHDKNASTSERVGFVSLRNLATDDPGQSWREMMTLCEAADGLKQRAGIKATGQKLSKPVYAFSINWHEDDRPDPAHMRETAESALRVLGMEHLQAVLVEHTDTAHRHIHVIVNLVDPSTGKSASVSHDGHKLDRWADRYEVAQGVIRSPDRRAKFEALDRGQKPPKRPTQASSREEWEATRGLKSEQARARAEAIRTAYAERAKTIRATQADAFQARRAEGDRLWQRYKADGKTISTRFQRFIDAIYKSRGSSAPHPHTEQAFRDLQESFEWKELGRRQYAQRRSFNAREQHQLSAIANAIRLHYADPARSGVSGLFKLAVSGSRRRDAFNRMQEREKGDLRRTQKERRKSRADVLRAACRFELSKCAASFQRQRKELSIKHAGEAALQKAEWRALANDRRQAWAANSDSIRPPIPI